jgi:hypothetical protein
MPRLLGGYFFAGVVDNLTTGSDNRTRMSGTMAHLETERLAREARREARRRDELTALCPECGATVTVRQPDEDRDRGECRCLCGLVFEVEAA